MNQHKKKTWKLIKKYRFVYLLLLPVLLYFFIFSYLPLFMGIVQSFQKVKLMGTSEWVGWQNYLEIMKDKSFISSIINGFIIGIGTLLLTFASSLIVALGINELKESKIKRIIQTTSYLPHLFSWTVVGGIWINILGPNGFVNTIRGFFDSKTILFMTEDDLAQLIMILTGAWKGIGYMAILFLASIVAINPNLFEAAQIDSASRLKQIKKIIIPDLKPTMATVFILGLMGLFTNFDQVYVMGNPAIIQKIRTPILYIFENGISRFNIGIATAGSVIVLLLTMIIIFIVRYLLREDL
ncbi:ABC transporter permease subunit [Ignavigranum ruoffiae]|uniref:ABC transporter permease subunit n=1 Tax=Ignavigranum ruoffiae TaxID=89093 RepID=UPI0020584999|nr:ABC transporter permease subunit [Ignavigranum ruoffiae]UPQ86139.1 ABC transporter permease subunit [Ignavigranum ruoffiae]